MTISFAIAATIVVFGALLGVALTAATLPGIWTMLLIALLCWWWQPGMFQWWTIITVIAIAILAEIAEFFASALGSKKAGGTKWGAIGSLIGSLLGAILGTPFFPIVGTIIGAVLGAGVGAFAFEAAFEKRGFRESWRDSARSGQGAAIGRLLSTVIKAAFASVAAVLLVLGALMPFA